MGKPYSGSIIPGGRVVNITPSATIFDECRSLWIGTAGTINITFKNGETADGMPALEGLFPFKVTAVRAGGTASDIWAIY